MGEACVCLQQWLLRQAQELSCVHKAGQIEKRTRPSGLRKPRGRKSKGIKPCPCSKAASELAACASSRKTGAARPSCLAARMACTCRGTKRVSVCQRQEVTQILDEMPGDVCCKHTAGWVSRLVRVGGSLCRFPEGSGADIADSRAGPACLQHLELAQHAVCRPASKRIAHARW